MKTAKRIALYAFGALMIAIWAAVVDGVAAIGSPAYLGYYPAMRLCNSLHPGMELRDVEARIYRLGRPSAIDYRSGQLFVSSLDSNCTVDIDPTTKRVTNLSTSPNPLIF